MITCNGCGKVSEDELVFGFSQKYHPWYRYDFYNIFTGVYCDECYDGNGYPYRKDEYFDAGYAGESLEER
jgi:hypothetical protein